MPCTVPNIPFYTKRSVSYIQVTEHNRIWRCRSLQNTTIRLPKTIHESYSKAGVSHVIDVKIGNEKAT